MSDELRLRKRLDTPLPAAVWPAGIEPAAFGDVEPRLLHAVLETAFPGMVAALPDWYGNLTADEEFDPALCIPALAADGSVAGFTQCWTGGFIKDLVVAPAQRRRGVGEALLWTAFAAFQRRGIVQVDLKTKRDNAAARRLYARVGIVEVAS